MTPPNARTNEGGAPPRPRRLTAWILGALFLAALLPRLYHVRSPFMNFADHNTANFSIFARNYLERGILRTRLGQVREVGRADPEVLTVFAHHPPTISVLTSLVFAAAGISEAAARVLPLLFSAATAPLIFLLARRIIGAGWGLLAALLFAAAPGAIYFGQMLDHESFVTFSGLGCLYAWCRHAETERFAWWRACLALLVVTVILDWPGAYLAAALAAASVLSPATRPRWMRLASQAGLAAAATLAAVTAHIALLKGSLGDLAASLSMRVLSTPDLPFTWGEYLHRIRVNLEYALTPPGFRMAMGGAAAAVAGGLALMILGARRSSAASASGAPAAAAIAIFGAAHHAIFTNACHFNEHLVYYLLPSLALLAAAGPAVLHHVASLWLPRKVAAAAALAVVMIPIGGFAREAPRQVWSYFNEISAPGWPLLGQALNGIVPEEGALLSPDALANPQFLHSLWRPAIGNVTDLGWLGGNSDGAYFLRDLAAPASPGVDGPLSRVPYAEALGFALYDLKPGAPAPEIPSLRPVPAEWQEREDRFGDALVLSMSRFAPESVRLDPFGATETFLGVRWTPQIAAGRIVHASFAWERLAGTAATLVPDYELAIEAGGRTWRAARMWPLPSKVADLARLAPGETARHEVDWFFGEWSRDGDYEIRISVFEGSKRFGAIAGSGGEKVTPYLSLGRVSVRISTSE